MLLQASHAPPMACLVHQNVVKRRRARLSAGVQTVYHAAVRRWHYLMASLVRLGNRGWRLRLCLLLAGISPCLLAFPFVTLVTHHASRHKLTRGRARCMPSSPPCAPGWLGNVCSFFYCSLPFVCSSFGTRVFQHGGQQSRAYKACALGVVEVRD